MPHVELSEKATAYLDELLTEGADDYLLDRLAGQLEAIAESPSAHTETAKFPYPPNRLMANFGLFDATGRRWGFTVTLRRTADEEGVYILTINAGLTPASYDD
jgi:hypothetical protein